MDVEEKREKERLKKKRQREKLKLDQAKYDAAKKKDAERKRSERRAFKELSEKHPRKYKQVLDNVRENTAARVRRHRQKQKENTEVPTPNSQKQRREKIMHSVRQLREKQQLDQEKNRLRVRNHRLRVKLHSPKSNENDGEGYNHRSSESRALKRLKENLPQTPAKKAKLIEKVIIHSTPRSRKLLVQSSALRSVTKEKIKRKLDIQSTTVESLFVGAKKTNKQRRSAAQLVASNLLKKSRKISAVSSMLGVSRKTLNKYASDDSVKRKVRKDAINDEQAQRIQNFYLEDASREMPNKRDVMIINGESGEKVLIQKHMMEMTQQEAFKKFKEQNPALKIGQRKFDHLRPSQVKRACANHRIVCCCTYCENVRMKVQSMNTVLAEIQPFQSTQSVLEKTLCATEGEYHKKECLQRQCDKCGTKLLKSEYEEFIERNKTNKSVGKNGVKNKCL